MTEDVFLPTYPEPDFAGVRDDFDDVAPVPVSATRRRDAGRTPGASEAVEPNLLRTHSFIAAVSLEVTLPPVLRAVAK